MRRNTFSLVTIEAARWAQRFSLSQEQRRQDTPGGVAATVTVGRVSRRGRVSPALPELEIAERDEGRSLED